MVILEDTIACSYKDLKSTKSLKVTSENKTYETYSLSIRSDRRYAS